jgi:hypothetical protein
VRPEKGAGPEKIFAAANLNNEKKGLTLFCGQCVILACQKFQVLNGFWISWQITANRKRGFAAAFVCQSLARIEKGVRLEKDEKNSPALGIDIFF